MKQTAPWSNSIKNMQQELAAANHPQIRVLRVEKTVSDYPKTDAHVVGWSVCTPDSVSDFSAVAYFFARELEQKEHVPIGVVEASWGGTPAEAWTSLDSLSADASLMPVFRYRAHMMDYEPTTLLNLQKMQADMDRKIAQGQTATMPWHLDPDSWAPAALFNGMIAPLLPCRSAASFGIREKATRTRNRCLFMGISLKRSFKIGGRNGGWVIFLFFSFKSRTITTAMHGLLSEKRSAGL